MFYHTNKDKLNNLQRIVQLHLMHFVVQTQLFTHSLPLNFLWDQMPRTNVTKWWRYYTVNREHVLFWQHQFPANRV